MRNLLTNPKLLTAAPDHEIRCYTPLNSQGQAYYDTGAYGNIVRPEGYGAWCEHSEEFRPPWDPGNTRGRVVPEVKQTEVRPDGSPMFPQRWHGDARGLAIFKSYGIYVYGLHQVVDVAPGAVCHSGAWGHGWVENGEWNADPGCSWGAECAPFAMKWSEIETQFTGQTLDALRSLAFVVGLDPTGGTDPYAESVIWGPVWAVYNRYAEIRGPSLTATGPRVAYHIMVASRYQARTCDAYVTDLFLFADESVTPEPPAPPVIVEPEPDPPAPIGSYDYPVIATGSKLHPHAIGEAGTYDMLVTLMAQRYKLPIVKIVAPQTKDLPAIRNLLSVSPYTRIIGRVIEGDGGFNPQGWGPQLDAETYMRQFVTWAKAYPEVTWWELWNEEDPADHVAMARFALRCMDIAEREGFKLALMSYSSGVPEPEEWRAIWEQTQFFQRARAGGHILALHAYCRTSNQTAIAAHLLRAKRDLYDALLIPGGCVVPFVLTEYSVDESGPGVGISDWETGALMAEYGRVDDMLADLWYCLGASVYTFGQQQHYSHNTRWRAVTDLILENRWRQNALPPAPEEQPEQTELPPRYTIMADPTYMDEAQLDAAFARGRAELHDVSVSWQTAAQPIDERRQEWASNTINAGPMPEGMRDAYRAFVAARDPEAVLLFDEPVPAPPTGGDGGLWFAYPTTHLPSVITSPYGPRGSGFHHGVDLRSSWGVWRDELIAAIDGEVILVGYESGREYFGYQVQIRARVDGDTVVVRYAHLVDGGAYVRVGDRVTREQKIGRPDNTGQSTADHLHFDVRVNGEYIDPTDLIRWPSEDVPAPAAPLLGFNDPENTGAGRWMLDNGLGGLLVIPIAIGTQPARLNLTEYANAGIRVLVNLRYGWSTDCGSSGTFPVPGSDEWTRFVRAAGQTLRDSVGVWGWEIGNEVNNPREFPREGALYPDAVITTYNTIRNLAGAGVRMAPGALDPFNAQAGDPRDWLRRIWTGIAGAEFVAAHGYSRGPDPNMVGSGDHFADPPLTWQGLNYPLCITALLEALPAQHRSLPVYVTEFNHLYRTQEPDWGWVSDDRAAQVVRAACDTARAQGYAGLALYRWSGDAWEVARNGAVLDAVRELLI